jgi:hypothetical protein
LRAVARQEAELRRLIPLVLADAPHEQLEALAVALADPEAALESYRLLAADLAHAAPNLPTDDRRPCNQCRNLSDDAQCRAAWRGEPLGFFAPRIYHPVVDLPQHCAGLSPFSDDPDQRPGRERWPSLLAVRTEARNG